MERYIGIENEFITFHIGRRVSCSQSIFDRLRSATDIRKGTSCIRTKYGVGYYIDGCELELVTPPVPINKGFASRLTDSLLLGRDHILYRLPEYKHTGYSMHWNLTSNLNFGVGDFMVDLHLPFRMFSQTPLSRGIGYRDKPGRFELLGDSINDEHQVNATALLLGAYALACENIAKRGLCRMPIEYNRTPFIDNMQVRRNTDLSFFTIGLRQTEASVQNYLEAFYKHISPFVKALAEGSEQKNLEDFIFGEKKLEIEKKAKYAKLKEKQGFISSAGIYKPIRIQTGRQRPEPLEIVFSGKTFFDLYPQQLPREAALLGQYAYSHSHKIERLDWDEAKFTEIPDGEFTLQNIPHVFRYNKFVIKGIDALYAFISQLKSTSSWTRPIKYEPTLDLTAVDPVQIEFNPKSKRLTAVKKQEQQKKPTEESKTPSACPHCFNG